MIATLRHCLEMLPAATRARWAAIVPLALVTGVLEAGAAAVVLALVQVVNDPSSVSTIPAASAIATWFPSSSPSGIVLGFTVLAIAYHIVKSLVLAGSMYVRHQIVAESRAALSTFMLRGYLAAPFAVHVARNSADLGRSIAALPNTVCEVLLAAAMLLSETLVTAGLLLVLVVAAPGVTIAAGVAAAALVLGTLYFTRALAHRLGRHNHALRVEVDQVLQQALGGIKELKVLDRTRTFDERHARLHHRALELGVMSTTLNAVPPLVVETCFVVGVLLVIAFVTATGSAGAGALPLLAVFTYSGFRAVPAINRMTWRINTIREHAAAVEAVYADFHAIAPFAQPGTNRPAPQPAWHTLSVRGVTFRYDDADRNVLQGADLDVRRGESIGIVGATGAGKTTLVDVLVGLLSPASGAVVLDGTRRVDEVRPRTAYVPQSIFVADDTLARNVAFGVPDEAIDHGRVWASLEAAQLGAAGARWPDGLQTVLGERGARLSGGERQRVGIARALYHQPDLLVLDEATSALDGVTEAAVLRALAALNVTTIMVAHRLSTIGHCDRIAVVAHGRVAAVGRFDDLLRTSPDFRRFVDVVDRDVREPA